MTEAFDDLIRAGHEAAKTANQDATEAADKANEALSQKDAVRRASDYLDSMKDSSSEMGGEANVEYTSPGHWDPAALRWLPDVPTTAEGTAADPGLDVSGPIEDAPTSVEGTAATRINVDPNSLAPPPTEPEESPSLPGTSETAPPPPRELSGFEEWLLGYARNNLLTPEQQAQLDEALKEDPSLLDGLTIENVYRDPSILTDRIQDYLAEHPPPTDQTIPFAPEGPAEPVDPFAPASEEPAGADSANLSDPALYNTGVAGPLGTPPPGTVEQEDPGPLDPNAADPDVSGLPLNLADVLTPEQMQALDQLSQRYGDTSDSSAIEADEPPSPYGDIHPTETGPGLDPSMFDDAEAAGPTIGPSPEPSLDPSQLEGSLTEPSGVTDLGSLTDPKLTDPSLMEEPDTADQDAQDQDFEGI